MQASVIITTKADKMIGHQFKVGSSIIDGNTVGFYPLDGNLRDKRGGSAGTLVGSPTYTTTPSVNLGGAYWFQTTGTGQGATFPPNPFQRATGTFEFILNHQDASAAGFNIWRATTGGANRRSELYIYAGTLYYFSDYTGNNSPVVAVSTDTSYYIALTWDSTNINVWVSTLPAYPTSSIFTANSPRFDLVTLSASVLVPNPNADADPDTKARRMVISQVKRTKFPTI